MQRFLQSIFTLVLFSNIATAGESPPQASYYAPANSAMWRPQEQATTQQNEPPARQQSSSSLAQNRPVAPAFPQQPHPHEIRGQQQYPAPYDAYGYQERYDPGYYAYPETQPGYWGESAYPTNPSYPSGYYQAQPYSYPYIYETAPASPSYAVPPGYSYPPNSGYTQEYYAPEQPPQEPGYEGYYPPGYGPDYNNRPGFQTEPPQYGSQQIPYPPESESLYGYQPGNQPVPEYSEQPSQYPVENNREWRPNTPQETTANHQQTHDSNGLLVNGAPAVFRPWTPPDIESTQDAAAQ